MWRSLLLVVSALVVGTAPASAQEEEWFRIEYCGYTFPVASYSAQISGLDIELTANDRLVVNGRVLAEHNPWRRDEPPRLWRDSADTAEIAVGRNEYVVRTAATDCIDHQSTRIYVVSERGLLRATFTYPHAFERVVLSYRANDIVYATNYYCEFADGAPQGQVWIHVLRSEADEFVRESRPRAEVCVGNDAQAAGFPLHFMPMRPALPAR